MKYEIIRSKDFKKSYKKLDSKDKEKVLEILNKLGNDEPLEAKYRDHKLKGEFRGFRECHIKPDLLLIYQKHENILILICIDIGSHSELFRK